MGSFAVVVVSPRRAPHPSRVSLRDGGNRKGSRLILEHSHGRLNQSRNIRRIGFSRRFPPKLA